MRSFSVSVLLIALVASGFAAGQQSLVQSQGQVLAFAGSSTGLTDGDLAPGMPSGERFGGAPMDNAVIADDGNVLFRAKLLSNTGTVLSPTYLQFAYFYGDSRGNLVKLLRGGDAEPSGTIPNAILSTSTSGNALTSGLRMTGNGLIMFGATIWDFVGSSITTANDTALYIGYPGSWSILAREGDVAPGTGGATYTQQFSGMSQQPTCINNNGYVLFQSSLAGAGATPPVTTANNAAWFGGTPSGLVVLLRKGDVAPGGEIISALGSLSQMNASGQVVTDVTFLAGSGTNPVTTANDRAVWICTPGSGCQQLVREGDASPIPGTFFANATNTWAYGTGSTTFNSSAQLLDNTTLTGAVTTGVDDRAVVLLSLAGNQVVCRRGSPAPGCGGALFDVANDSSLCLTDSGRVAFQSSLVNGVTTSNDTGIWTGTPGNLVLVCREGDVAPGTGGATFGNTSGMFMCMNGAGQILFQNSLSTGSSLWSWDPVVGLQCVVKSGDSIEVQPGVFRTASGSTGGVQFTDGNSRALMIADDGTVAVRVSMNDGLSYASSAMVKVHVGSLWGTPARISEVTGATHNLYVNAGIPYAGLNYVVAGSATGTVPGTQIGMINVPLDIDSYTYFSLQNLNVLPYVNTAGALNADGRALAQIIIPPLPGLAGIVVYHSYGVIDGMGNVVFAGQAAPLQITP